MEKRIIKFRAWDTERKEMRQGSHNILIDSFDGDTLWQFGFDVPIPMPNVILMQFTGLHDKNGKEIYEGDILKPNRSDCHYSIITWINETFEYKAIYKTSYKEYKETHNNWIGISNNLYAMSLGWIKGQSFEVIGNIYESPNLLENK